jgi:hypothetical protein
MVEVDEIRKIVDPIPSNWSFAFPTVYDSLECRCTDPYLRMAGHAGFGRGNISRCCDLYRGVAIATIKTEFTRMKAVFEIDWLGNRDTYLVVECSGEDNEGSNQQNSKYKTTNYRPD